MAKNEACQQNLYGFGNAESACSVATHKETLAGPTINTAYPVVFIVMWRVRVRYFQVGGTRFDIKWASGISKSKPSSQLLRFEFMAQKGSTSLNQLGPKGFDEGA
jgi:hypothetical protein